MVAGQRQGLLSSPGAEGTVKLGSEQDRKRGRQKGLKGPPHLCQSPEAKSAWKGAWQIHPAPCMTERFACVILVTLQDSPVRAVSPLQS